MLDWTFYIFVLFELIVKSLRMINHLINIVFALNILFRPNIWEIE